jgi:hypothetical protein
MIERIVPTAYCSSVNDDPAEAGGDCVGANPANSNKRFSIVVLLSLPGPS